MTLKTAAESQQAIAPYPWQIEVWEQFCQQLHDNQLSHALLICGEEGLGKRDLARTMADFLLCQNPLTTQACGQCRACELGSGFSEAVAGAAAIARQQPDLVILEPAATSGVIGVDQVRNLIEFVNKTSHSSARKVVIINQADGLNINASNALLKTLEEPASDTFILLVTALPGRMLATLRSRCRRLELAKPAPDVAIQWLRSVTDFTDAASVLDACSGRPLQAKTMLETGDFGLRVEFIGFLSQLVTATLNPAEFLGKINHLEERVVVEFLSYTSSMLVKYVLSDSKSDLVSGRRDGSTDAEPRSDTDLGKRNNDKGLSIDSVLTKLFQILSATDRSRQSLCKDLLSLYDEAVTARVQLQAGANPNPQLVMESLLWRWSELVQPSHKRNY